MTLRDLLIRLYGETNVRDNGGGEVSVNCCFCPENVGKKDFKQRLGINTETGVSHCFRCEFKGSKRYTFKELCRVFGVTYTLDFNPSEETYVPKVKEIEKAKEEEFHLPSEYEPLWKNVDDRIGKKALKYLLDRNVTQDQIKKHRIGFCAVGKYAYRIVIPVVYKEKLVGIVARDFSGKAEYKYLNSEGSKSIFNVPNKVSRICNLGEGCFDAMSLERGVDPSEDCIAALGSKLTKQQLKILNRYRQIVIWPDYDRPGIEGAIKKAIQLKKMQKCVFIVMPEATIDEVYDLGVMHVQEVKDARKAAIQYSKAVAALLRLRIANIVPPKKKRVYVTSFSKSND